MNNNSIKLIQCLLSQYENSAYFKGGVSSRRVFLNDKNSIFHHIFNTSDSSNLKPPVVKDLLDLQSKGYILINIDNPIDNNIFEIVLNIENVDSFYKEIGIKNPKDELNQTLNYLKSLNYDGVANDFVKDEINCIETKFKTRKLYYSNIEQLDDILKSIDAIYHLKEEIMERDFSSKYLKDSKKFEHLKNAIVRIIKDYDQDINQELNVDETLASLYIVKNSTYAMIKNNLNFQLNNQVINLNDLGYEFLLDDRMIKSLKLLPSNFNKVITVENLTSFKMLDDKEAVIIYLAGFHNHTKQMLLEKIYDIYPDKQYLHFSDIDVGGFRIFNNLLKKTHIPFKPYRMGIDELKLNVNLKPLTPHDKEALNMMIDDENYQVFKEVMKYMLDNNIKLEQENID